MWSVSFNGAGWAVQNRQGIVVALRPSRTAAEAVAQYLGETECVQAVTDKLRRLVAAGCLLFTDPE